MKTTRKFGRRDVLKGAAGLAAAGFVAAPDGAAGAAEVRLPHRSLGGDRLAAHDGVRDWTKVLNEKSGGRIDAQHFPASQLGSYSQNIEQNRIGTIQVTTGGPDTEENVAPEIAATGGAPGFIYNDEAHVDRVLQGDIGREISQIARAQDRRRVRRLRRGRLPPHPVEEPGDDSTNEGPEDPHARDQAVGRLLEHARREPDPARLRRAVLRALDRADRRARVRRVLDHRLQVARAGQAPDLTSHWFLPKATRVNARWLDSLPADLQSLVRDTAKEVFAEQRKANRANAASTLEELKAAGVTVHQLRTRRSGARPPPGCSPSSAPRARPPRR